ncbi:MAG: hypothetical protein NVS1B4_19130 [Gemmatimonadaceae bacterium]
MINKSLLDFYLARCRVGHMPRARLSRGGPQAGTAAPTRGRSVQSEVRLVASSVVAGESRNHALERQAMLQPTVVNVVTATGEDASSLGAEGTRGRFLAPVVHRFLASFPAPATR